MLLGDLREATDAFTQAAALNAEDGDSLYRSAITHFDNIGMLRKPWQDSRAPILLAGLEKQCKLVQAVGVSSHRSLAPNDDGVGVSDRGDVG